MTTTTNVLDRADNFQPIMDPPVCPDGCTQGLSILGSIERPAWICEECGAEVRL